MPVARYRRSCEALRVARRVLRKLFAFHRWTAQFRARYGPLRGLRFGLQWRRALYAASPGTIVGLNVPGLAAPVYVRARTVDVELFDRILVHGQAELPVPGDPAFIVDAGANIGLTAVYFASRWPRARIVALEIEEGNFALLRRNVAPYPNVTPLLCGLWSGPAALTIENPGAEPWAFMAAKAPRGTHGRTVAALGVLDVMRRFGVERIDLLKVDIEGSEREVFGPGAEAWLDRVGCIAVELHDWFVPGCQDALDRAVAGRPLRRDVVGEYTVLRPESGPG